MQPPLRHSLQKSAEIPNDGAYIYETIFPECQATLKTIACGSGGIFQAIPDGGSLSTAMSFYYRSVAELTRALPVILFPDSYCRLENAAFSYATRTTQMVTICFFKYVQPPNIGVLIRYSPSPPVTSLDIVI